MGVAPQLSYPPTTALVRDTVQNNDVMIYKGNFEALVRFADLDQFRAALGMGEEHHQPPNPYVSVISDGKARCSP